MKDLDQIPVTELHRHLGAHLISRDRTRFAVFSPTASQITVDVVDGAEGLSLEKQDSGFHTAEIDGVGLGDHYFYRVDGGPQRPDPSSRYQPWGIHGPSLIDDWTFDWKDADWTGPSRDDLILYEMHVGTFTEGGTWSTALERLPELAELGINAIELMPVASSAGRWNWGYDGVALFAPMNTYGTTHDFRRFIDRCHDLGIAVFLDVVYNHLGPEGNYLHDFGPYLSSRHRTVWGDAPNFDDPVHGDNVRRWFIANAIHWLDEYHLDGLRVDAIHCMADDREPHVAVDLAQAVQDWTRAADRNVLMIAESNVYDPEMTRPIADGGVGFDAMWSDDFLHSTFAVLRPGEQLCHRRYGGDDLERVLRHGYVYEGTLREERHRTTPSQRVDSQSLVYSIQNHDFIGNHPLGQRLHQLTSHEAHRAAAAMLILSPAIPMLFMGEEFACENPFRFFVDFKDPLLRQSVIDGRRREYPQHDWENGILPTEREAFESAKIGPKEDGNEVTWRWYRALIQLRETYRRELLLDAHLQPGASPDSGLYTLDYSREGDRLLVAIRLNASEVRSTHRLDVAGTLLLDSHAVGDGERPVDSVELQPNHAVVIRM